MAKKINSLALSVCNMAQYISTELQIGASRDSYLESIPLEYEE